MNLKEPPRWKVTIGVMENGKEKPVVKIYGIESLRMAVTAALTVKHATPGDRCRKDKGGRIRDKLNTYEGELYR